MRSLSLLAVLLLCGLLPKAYTQCRIDYSQWELFFEEDFEDKTVDDLEGDWRFSYHWGNYTRNPTCPQKQGLLNKDNIKIEDGVAKFFVTKLDEPIKLDDSTTAHYYTGNLISNIAERPECVPYNTTGFYQGMFEIRCKFPDDEYEYLYPAFWLHHFLDYSVFEYHTSQTYEEFFSTSSWCEPCPDNYYGCASFHEIDYQLSDCWHTFTFVWTEETFSYFLDGVEYRTDRQDIRIPWTCDWRVADIIIGMGVNCPWEGIDIPSDKYFEVDYVRVYKPKDNDYSQPYKSASEMSSAVALGIGSENITAFELLTDNQLVYLDGDGSLHHAFQLSGIWVDSLICKGCAKPNAGITYNPANGNVYAAAESKGIVEIEHDGVSWNVKLLEISSTIKDGLSYSAYYQAVLFRSTDDALRMLKLPEDDELILTELKNCGRAFSCSVNGNIYYQSTDAKLWGLGRLAGKWVQLPLNTEIELGGLLLVAEDGRAIVNSSDQGLWTRSTQGDWEYIMSGCYSNASGSALAVDSSRFYYISSDAKVWQAFHDGMAWRYFQLSGQQAKAESNLRLSMDSEALYYLSSTGNIQQMTLNTCEITNPPCWSRTPMPSGLSRDISTCQDIELTRSSSGAYTVNNTGWYPYQVRIFDSGGALLSKFVLEAESVSKLELSSFPAATYFLVGENSQGNVCTKQIQAY